MIKALLLALLGEPIGRGCAAWSGKRGSNFTARLALLEELKTLPAGVVWDYYLTTLRMCRSVHGLDG